MRVLITGASGQVGGALLRSAPAGIDPRAFTRAELYPTAAHRPANSVLECGESIDQLALTPKHWRINLATTLAGMAAA